MNARRSCSFIMALVMLLMVFLPTAVALAATSSVQFTVSSDKASAAVGEEITITVSTSEIENLAGVVANLLFDTSKVEYVSGSMVKLFDTFVMQQFTATIDTAWTNFFGSYADDHATDGHIGMFVSDQSPSYGYTVPGGTGLFSAKFKVKADAPNGATVFSISESGQLSANAAIVIDAGNLTQAISVTTSPANVSITGGVNPALTGTLSISGSAVFGQILSAVPSDIPVGAELSYQWYRDENAITEAIGSTYELVQDDIGSAIKVTATAEGYSGSIVSAETATVTKAPRSAPNAPTLASKTDTSITLNTITDAQYAINNSDSAPESDWQGSPTFTGLSANTPYYFFAKYPSSATHEASPASTSFAVTTDKTMRSITVNVSPAGTGSAYADEANAKEGDTITLTAEPESGYYFSEWESSDVTVTNNSFTMPDYNVTVTAKFSEKAQPTIVLTNKTVSYTGSGIAIDAPTLTGVTSDEVIISYTDGTGGSVAGLPTDAGTYTATASFQGDATRKSALDTATLTITKVQWAAPSGINVTSFDADSITFDAKAGQKYLVLPAAEAIPNADTTGWVSFQADTSYVWNGLSAGTNYKVYTCIVPDNNHTVSDIVATGLRTAHTWALAVTENNVAVNELSFFARTGYATAPGAKTVKLSNNGTGAFKDVTVELTGTNASDFTINTSAVTSALAAGEDVTFTIQPNGSLANGIYTATITIDANKDDIAETGALSQQSITLTFTVADKIDVTIGNLNSSTVTYDGSAKGVDSSTLTTSVAVGQTAYTGSLTVWYEGVSGTSYTKSTTKPSDAGTYQITAEVPSTDPDYMGSATATLTISPRALAITGLSVVSKVYDGTADATLTGGTLTNTVTGDDVSVSGGIPAAGSFADKNAGVSKSVSITALTLAGADKDNYTLTQPTLTGTISAKSVKPNVSVADRDYDGTAVIDHSLISASFPAGAIISGDSVTVTYGDSTVASKNAGEDKPVTLGTREITGASNNYIVETADVPEVTITPFTVDVTVSGTTPVTYDGSAKALSAAYTPLGSDIANVSVLYNGSATVPMLAGSYAITAQINDTNYDLGNTAGVSTLVINKGILTHSDVNRTVAFEDARNKTVNTTDFQIAAPAGSVAPTGAFAIGTVTDTDNILDGTPTLVNGVISFKIKSTAAIGKTASIAVEYTPAANTYEAVTANINVTVGAEGYTNTVTGAPATVNLGEDIVLTGMKLHTVFDSGKPAEDVPVTASMISGYDKTATGAGSIGQKTITVTHPSNVGRVATFSINVLDVMTDITVTVPSVLSYAWNSTALDLSGGSITPIMRSGLPTSVVPLSIDMLNVTNTILSRLGTYPVNVVYGGVTENDAFIIEVKQAPVPVSSSPSANQPGVVDLPEDVTFQTGGGQTVDAADVRLVVEPVSSGDLSALQAEIGSQSSFSNVPPANILALDISLEQMGTGVLVQPSGKITIRIPYPAGTDSSDTFTILHKKSDGTVAVYTPAKTASGLEFDVDSFSAFAIGWIEYSGHSGGGWKGHVAGLSTQKRMNAFWEQVRTAILGAIPGSVIRVNARNFDQMSTSVMNALRSSDVTLIIQWNGGTDIIITSDMALTPEPTRDYYPLQFLSELFIVDPPKTDDPEEGEAWLRAQRAAALKPISQAIATGAGMVIDVIAPEVAEDDREIFTQASAGLFGLSEGEEAISMIEILPDPTDTSNGIPIWAILLAGVAVLGGAAVLLNRRRLFNKS